LVTRQPQDCYGRDHDDFELHVDLLHMGHGVAGGAELSIHSASLINGSSSQCGRLDDPSHPWRTLVLDLWGRRQSVGARSPAFLSSRRCQPLANMVLEDTVLMPNVSGAGSPEVQQLVADPDSFKDSETADDVG
jgi:hypothetical protein